MSERQQETAFLRQLIRYHQSAERDQLEERITRIQRDERCVWRAVCLMALLIALAVAGLCYAVVFLEDLSANKWHLLIEIVCALGLASLISLAAFGGYWLAHRIELNRRREECRQLVINLLKSHLGSAHPIGVLGLAKQEEIIIHRNEAAMPAPAMGKLSQMPGNR